MVVRILALILMMGLAGCGAGYGGGDDNTKRGGADAVTGPSTSVVVNCQSADPAHNIGDTATVVNVNCPGPVDNSTRPPAPAPGP